MSEKSKKKPEKLSDVANEFVTRIPKALIDRPPRESTHLVEPPAEDELDEALLVSSSLDRRLPPPKAGEKLKPKQSGPNSPLAVTPPKAIREKAARFAEPPLVPETPTKEEKEDDSPQQQVTPILPPSRRPRAVKQGATPITRPPLKSSTATPHANKTITPPTPTSISVDSAAKKAVMTPPRAIKEKSEQIRQDQEINVQNQEIRIDLSASKSLTHIVCALAINPGMGGEIEVEDRRKNIQSLIAKAHELTEFICKKIKNGRDVPDYLYGSIFQESTRHVAALWNKEESLDTSTAEKIAAEIFNHENPLLDPFTYDSASQDSRNKLEGKERAELELQVALMSAMGKTRSTVLSMRIGALIEGYGERVENMRDQFANTPYLFGQEDESKIVTDLVEAALRIAEKNKLNALDESMSAQWNVSMIYRAVDLVRSEYEMFVERLVRSSFSDLELYEQTLNSNNDMYAVGLTNIEQRAEKTFNMISKTARRLALANPPETNEDGQSNDLSEREKP